MLDNFPATSQNSQTISSFYDESLRYSKQGSYFHTKNFTDIITQVGSSVEIPCRVHSLGENMVRIS